MVELHPLILTILGKVLFIFTTHIRHNISERLVRPALKSQGSPYSSCLRPCLPRFSRAKAFTLIARNEYRKIQKVENERKPHFHCHNHGAEHLCEPLQCQSQTCLESRQPPFPLALHSFTDPFSSPTKKREGPGRRNAAGIQHGPAVGVTRPRKKGCETCHTPL